MNACSAFWRWRANRWTRDYRPTFCDGFELADRLRVRREISLPYGALFHGGGSAHEPDREDRRDIVDIARMFEERKNLLNNMARSERGNKVKRSYSEQAKA